MSSSRRKHRKKILMGLGFPRNHAEVWSTIEMMMNREKFIVQTKFEHKKAEIRRNERNPENSDYWAQMLIYGMLEKER